MYFLFFGVKIMHLGLTGWRKGVYPLSADRDLTGKSARLVATLIMVFGALTFLCGVATIVFGYFRVRQLLN